MKLSLSHFGNSRLAEWLIAYLAFAWLTVQIADVIADVWALSAVFQRRLHVALAFGVPAAAVLAWFHGEKGRQRVARSELLVLASISGVASLAVPSVGGAGIVSVLGVSPSIVLPAALISMLIIPVVLMIRSAYNAEKHSRQTERDSQSHEFTETQAMLWNQLLATDTQEEILKIREEISRLRTHDPDSVVLQSLEIMADRLGRQKSVGPPFGDMAAEPVC